MLTSVGMTENDQEISNDANDGKEDDGWRVHNISNGMLKCCIFCCSGSNVWTKVDILPVNKEIEFITSAIDCSPQEFHAHDFQVGFTKRIADLLNLYEF